MPPTPCCHGCKEATSYTKGKEKEPYDISLSFKQTSGIYHKTPIRFKKRSFMSLLNRIGVDKRDP